MVNERHDEWREEMASKIGHLGTLATETRDTVAEVRKSLEKALEAVDKRVTGLEEVRVRALEDWRLSEKVLAVERAHVATAAAESAARAAEQAQEDRREDVRQRVTQKQFWVGVIITAAITILASLIASGHIF